MSGLRYSVQGLASFCVVAIRYTQPDVSEAVWASDSMSYADALALARALYRRDVGLRRLAQVVALCAGMQWATNAARGVLP